MNNEQNIKQWKAAFEEVQQLRRQLRAAECELLNAETKLAKGLLPKDAKAGEQFCMWYGDSLIAAKHINGNYVVSLRTQGKNWDG